MKATQSPVNNKKIAYIKNLHSIRKKKKNRFIKKVNFKNKKVRIHHQVTAHQIKIIKNSTKF